ncbi:MAG TPA: class I SAM-dependent methyltransferase [Stellaceae bacterium]|nr:class I SAM-dependent methyltransferase [Stellaceae bacterium]
MRPIPFEPHRFQSTVDHYVRGRLSYPTALIDRVVALTGLEPDDRVLDIGCGPGFLATAFARHAREVVGVDPEPAMLAAARAYAEAQGVTATLRQGSSYDLDASWGMFHLAVMGRSFHWMDRPDTLRRLDQMIEQGGAVALFGDRSLKLPENAWKQHFDAILEPFADQDPDRAERKGAAWIRHEAILLASPFNDLQRVSVIRRLETPTDRLIDRALSLSSTSPERLGTRQPELVAALRDVLNAVARDGHVAEVVELEALLAFRT